MEPTGCVGYTRAGSVELSEDETPSIDSQIYSSHGDIRPEQTIYYWRTPSSKPTWGALVQRVGETIPNASGECGSYQKYQVLIPVTYRNAVFWSRKPFTGGAEWHSLSSFVEASQTRHRADVGQMGAKISKSGSAKGVAAHPFADMLITV